MGCGTSVGENLRLRVHAGTPPPIWWDSHAQSVPPRIGGAEYGSCLIPFRVVWGKEQLFGSSAGVPSGPVPISPVHVDNPQPPSGLPWSFVSQSIACFVTDPNYLSVVSPIDVRPSTSPIPVPVHAGQEISYTMRLPFMPFIPFGWTTRVTVVDPPTEVVMHVP